MIRRAEVSIDDEFQELHRALTDGESAQLEANIRRDGRILDPIILWNHKVLDGHNRLEKFDKISAEDPTFSEPPFEEISLKDRAAAVEWIAKHQYGRRNNTPQELAYLRGKWASEEVAEIASASLRQNAANSETLQNKAKPEGRPSSGKKQAAERVAAETGVDESTVRRDMTYSQAVDTIVAATSGKTGQDIRSGTLKIPKKDVIALAKRTPEEISQHVRDLKMGRKPEANGKPSGGTKFDPSEFDHGMNPDVPATEVNQSADLAEKIKEQNRIIESYARSIVKHFDDNLPKDPWLDESRVNIARDQIKSAASTIRLSKAYEKPCPKCDGKGGKCKFCRGCGYLPKNSYEMAGGQ